MKHKTNIRRYRPSDLDGLMNVWENANKSAHPFLNTDFVNQVRQDIPTLYLPNAKSWVTSINGQIVGFISLLDDTIGALFVSPELHSLGIGTALTNKAQQFHDCLEVEVFEANAIGRRFYRGYGFQKVGEALHGQTGQMVLKLRCHR